MSNRVYYEESMIVKIKRFLPLFIILLIAAARFLFLEADPGLSESLIGTANNSGDEGYWAYAGRNLALFNQFITDEFSHAYAAPLSTAISYVFFKIFGVSMFSTRFPYAMFGVLSVLFVYKLVRKYDEKSGLIVALVLAVENYFFTYSRMGLPESMCSFFVLLSFYFILAPRKPIWAGVAFGLSVLTKIVAIWVAPVFVLFFILQWYRGEAKRKDIYRFIGGGAVIGVFYIFYIYHYYDGFVRNLLDSQSSGFKFFQNPLRAVADPLMGCYTASPSIALLLIFVGVYSSKIGLIHFLGEKGKVFLKQLNGADVAALSWLFGFCFSLIVLSDGNNRRMNFFTIPLAMIPGLLIRFNKKNAINTFSCNFSLLQRFVIFIPTILLVAMVGNKIIHNIDIPHIYYYIIGCFLIIGIVIFAKDYYKFSPFWKNILEYIPVFVWIALCAAPFSQYLILHIFPLAQMTIRISSLVRILTVMIWILFVFGFAFLAFKKNFIAVLVLVIINLSLDGYDLTYRVYSLRDSSDYLNSITTSEDYFIGTNCHESSLNAEYHPIMWYPSLDFNTQLVINKKPKYFISMVMQGVFPGHNPKHATLEDLKTIGVRKVEYMKDLELFLYPLGKRPTEILKLYRLFYE